MGSGGRDRVLKMLVLIVCIVIITIFPSDGEDNFIIHQTYYCEISKFCYCYFKVMFHHPAPLSLTVFSTKLL